MTSDYRIAPKLTGHIIGLNGHPVRPDPTTQPDTPNHTTIHAVPSPGDLRGIPAVGRHAGPGAITETIPGWNLDDWPIPDVA